MGQQLVSLLLQVISLLLQVVSLLLQVISLLLQVVSLFVQLSQGFRQRRYVSGLGLHLGLHLGLAFRLVLGSSLWARQTLGLVPGCEEQEIGIGLSRKM